MDVDVHGLIAFDWGAGVHTVTVLFLDLVGLCVGECIVTRRCDLLRRLEFFVAAAGRGAEAFDLADASPNGLFFGALDLNVNDLPLRHLLGDLPEFG
jgi:hypothetical protein